MTPRKYKLRFWGARGTIPTPGSGSVKFGGNTSCCALELDDKQTIIIDCGSGLRLLGRHLAANGGLAGRSYRIFLSHYHFDHIEGFALFQPLYHPDSKITIIGPSHQGRGPKEILESLLCPPYFPVSLADAPAQVEYETLDGAPVTIGDVTVDSIAVNHPGGCFSFRLRCGDRRIVYATDHEHCKPEIDEALLDFSRGADSLIYDATYEPAEYEEYRRGWGHSTWYAAVRLAIDAQVKRLVLFHHHPDYIDSELEQLVEVARGEFPSTEAAYEGLELPL